MYIKPQYFEFWRYKDLLKRTLADWKAKPHWRNKTLQKLARSQEGHQAYTVISACYNVEKYIGEFIESLLNQRLDFRNNIYLICVDDGSTDGTAAIIKRYAAQYPNNITYLYKENGGQSSARNLGMQHAKTEWITFTDPDDMLDYNCLYRVDRALAEHPQAAMAALNIVFYTEHNRRYGAGHPLAYKFGFPYTVRKVAEMGDFVQLSMPSALFRRSVIEAHGLSIDDRIRPSFEDGHFVARYLTEVQEAEALFLGSAKYYYRKRADGSSTLDGRWKDKRVFGDLIRYGYLDMLRTYAEKGITHNYAKQVFLYDIQYAIRRLIDNAESTAALPQEERTEFLRLLEQCFSYLSLQDLEEININGHSWFWKLAYAYRFKQWNPDFRYAVPHHYDSVGNQICLRLFCDREADIRATAGGRPVAATHDKYLGHTLAGELFLPEHYIWFPLGEAPLQLTCDGKPVIIAWREVWRREGVMVPPYKVAYPMYSVAEDYLLPVSGNRHERLFSTSYTEADTLLHKEEACRRLQGSKRHLCRGQYAHCWLFADSPNRADDNAEHLYRYVRAHAPEIPLYFLLHPHAADWARLEKDGFNLLPYGSSAHRAALFACDAVVSSHVGGHPFYQECAAEKRYIFLQHGVIENALHLSFRNLSCDMFVTTTPGEYESIGGGNSLYRFGDRELRLTGLPRHDHLLMLPHPAHKQILIMPTWRVGLHHTTGQALRNGDFTTNWREFLNHPYLRELHEKHGYNVVLLPHAGMRRADILTALDSPDFVQIVPHCSYQKLFSESTIGITDYTSAIFDMALLKRSILYFQFDEATFFEQQTFVRGYFNFRRDGFGPVSTTTEELVKHLHDIVENGDKPLPVYEKRMEETFPFRDGRNCERCFNAIVDLLPQERQAQLRKEK